MSSLEMVDYINSMRQPGEAELQHRSLMAKVPAVIGIEAAAKFSATAFYTNGTGAQVPRTIFNFPKREACLMAMSYSYDLQAKVFDRMTALEAGMVAVPSLPVPSKEPPQGCSIRWLLALPAGRQCRGAPRFRESSSKASLYVG